MKDYLNKCLHADCVELMNKLPHNAVDLVVTSPPYNVGKDYGQYNDTQQYEKYLKFVETFCNKLYRVVKSGGRVAINLPSSIKQSASSRMAYLSLDWVLIMRKTGFKDREWITWVKIQPAEVLTDSTAWGSWRSPSCPYLRDVCEYIIVMDKEQDKRTDRKGQNDITAEEFLKFTINCWYIHPSNLPKWHPVPFPEELVYRLVKLYTWQDDIVFDPFAGSFTTAVVCDDLNRNWICCDINEDFVKQGRRRIILNRQKQLSLV